MCTHPVFLPLLEANKPKKVARSLKQVYLTELQCTRDASHTVELMYAPFLLLTVLYTWMCCYVFLSDVYMTFLRCQCMFSNKSWMMKTL